jgi:hypothetical protein
VNEWLADYAGRDLLITPEQAFLTPVTFKRLDYYGSTDPTSPSIGRIWREKKRVCWVIPDPDDQPENPTFVLHRKVPYTVVSLETLALIRRLMGVDASSVLVNSTPPTNKGGQWTMDETSLNHEPEPDEPVDGEIVQEELLVSISVRLPPQLLGLFLTQTEVLRVFTFAPDKSSVSISVQPFRDDPEPPEA